MPEELHLVSGAGGRIVADGYSWMQAVHWVHGAGVYVPPARRPRFGETTLRLARVLSELTPCRPSIARLMRELGCSRRTVQYHLEILRACGLLAWRSIGTRLPMLPGQLRVECRASEYERLVPVAYDEALGIRTAGEGLERRMTGISEEGRGLIGELGKKAARRVRRTRRTSRHTRSVQPAETACCTPMVGGTTHLVSSTSDVDSKATGRARVEKSASKGKRSAKPSRVAGQGRRTVLGQVVSAAMMAAGDLMARVAYRRVPWVRQASHDQLRWVLNDVADRGWGPERAVAWLAEIAGQYGAGALWRPERPHALIARALRQEAEQAAYDQELRQDVAARVEPMDNAAMRELAGLAGLFALMDTPASSPESSPVEETLAQAHWAPRTVVAAIDDDVDAAIDCYGVDLVARYAGLAANPNVQIGVR
ncbi:HTH domain-containing protein [Kitasatospora cineracea]|uniref:HTH domain-containing protein n=1 Tax=Kitasatospora cineracea TaxID=88074 RepID=UPI0033FF5849